MLGSPLLLGRSFSPDEGTSGKDHVAILTHRLWRRLGADPKIVGRTVNINGDPYTVVGVMAPGAPDRWAWQLIVALVFKPEQVQDHSSRFWVVAGRLKAGIGLQQAQAEMSRITAEEAKAYPVSNQGWGAIVDPFKAGFLSSRRRFTLWLLLGAVGFLLLIACLNVANLLLAKGVARQREVAIRGALGAGPAAVFAEFLAENLVLVMAGVLLGVGAGVAILRVFVAIIPPDALPAEADLRLNLPVLLAMLGVAALAGVVFGCAPAWHAARLDPAAILKEGGHAGIGVSRHRLRRLLVIAEFGLALPLLAGAGLHIRSIWKLTHTDSGIRTDDVLTFFLDSVVLDKDPTPAKAGSYYRRLLAAIEAVPGVSRACAMNSVPLDSLYLDRPFWIVGRPEYASPSLRPSADLRIVTPGYFETFGIRIVRGRAFTENDNASSISVAMVNEAFAERYLRGFDPLRQRVVVDQAMPSEARHGPAAERQIVGVFHTVKSRGAREDNPEIDEPFWQETFAGSAIGVRTAMNPTAAARSIAQAAHAVDPQAAIYKTRTMRQVRDEALASDGFGATLFGAFGVLGLLLAAAGIYGVMAFSVTQRSREMAVRAAVGATRFQVVGLVVREGIALACAGLAAGSVGAWWVERAMRGILFGSGSLGLPVLGGAVLLLLLTAVMACWLPAVRAASAEPMRLMKNE